MITVTLLSFACLCSASPLIQDDTVPPTALDYNEVGKKFVNNIQQIASSKLFSLQQEIVLKDGRSVIRRFLNVWNDGGVKSELVSASGSPSSFFVEHPNVPHYRENVHEMNIVASIGNTTVTGTLDFIVYPENKKGSFEFTAVTPKLETRAETRYNSKTKEMTIDSLKLLTYFEMIVTFGKCSHPEFQDICSQLQHQGISFVKRESVEHLEKKLLQEYRRNRKSLSASL